MIKKLLEIIFSIVSFLLILRLALNFIPISKNFDLYNIVVRVSNPLVSPLNGILTNIKLANGSIFDLQSAAILIFIAVIIFPLINKLKI